MIVFNIISITLAIVAIGFCISNRIRIKKLEKFNYPAVNISGGSFYNANSC